VQNKRQYNCGLFATKRNVNLRRDNCKSEDRVTDLKYGSVKMLDTKEKAANVA
jgi:hypothetical protein